MRLILAAATFLSVLSPALAQPAPPMAKSPEQMLPAKCLVYFRYDGYEPHRAAYDKTALAKAMNEGLAEFFDHLFGRLFSLAADFPGGGNPKKQGKEEPVPPAVSQFLDCLWRNGFALTLEINDPTRGGDVEDLVHLTVVFPEGAGKKNHKALDGFFRFLAGVANAPVEATPHEGRKGHSFSLGGIKASWWVEGKHLVFSAGAEKAGGAALANIVAFLQEPRHHHERQGGAQPMAKALAVIDGRRPNVAAAPWFADLAGFKRYETDMRGFVDVETVVDWLAALGLEEPGLDNIKDRFARHVLLRHLGLTGLKNLTFHLGFDGKYQRSTVKLGVVGPEKRTGLLKLLTGPVAFAPDKLPPMPPDADYVSVRHVDWEKIYNYLRTTYSLFALSRLIETREWPGGFPDLDGLLGVDFRKDFLGQLDTTVVTFGAHSEGPFFLGQGFAVKVKDAAKVKKSLAAISKALGETSDMLVVEKRTFRGHDMHVFGNLFVPFTYTVHKDWLVFGLFPQPVQGFLLRSDGKYRTWKTPPEAHEALAKERKDNGKSKLLAVTVSDPRPAIEIGLALLPTVIQAINQSAGTRIVDVSKIPNAQAVNEWLFPNVGLFYDDGNALRWENHYSLNEPDDFFLLVVSPLAVAEFFWAGVARFNMKPPKGEPVPPPPKLPKAEAVPPPKPQMCPATAIEKDGVVHITVTIPKQATYRVARPVQETHYKTVTEAGVTRKVPYTAVRMVTETPTKTVMVQSILLPDGKKVQVTRKDGKAVDPKELPKLLAKETQVLVTHGPLDPKFLEKIDDRVLIITITPDTPPPPPPGPA